MQTAPAVLSPDRIDAMLAAVAEVCMDGVTEAGVWIKAAPDVEAFERASRALQTHCRNLRQTIAMKQRFDREQIALRAEAGRAAEEDRKEAAKVQKAAVGRHYWRARTHLCELVWNEYEEDDAQEVFNDLDECLGELSKEDPDAFLETPFEALIARFSKDFGIGEFKAEPEPAPHPELRADDPTPSTPTPPTQDVAIAEPPRQRSG